MTLNFQTKGLDPQFSDQRAWANKVEPDQSALTATAYSNFAILQAGS